MHDNLRGETEEDEFEKAEGESEGCPIMSVLHDLQTVPVEVNVAIEVHVVEGLQWDLVLPAVSNPIGLILEGQVMFDRAPWISGLFVLAGGEGRCEGPEGEQDGD